MMFHKDRYLRGTEISIVLIREQLGRIDSLSHDGLVLIEAIEDLEKVKLIVESKEFP